MSTTPVVSRIQDEELYFMRYFLALNCGKVVMARVFEWGFQGGHPIKDYLLSRPGYSNKKYKNEFNQDQRRKVTSSSPADVRSYDISLLFTLLQVACGLAEKADPVWTTYGWSLENLLFRLKQLRNNVVHEEQRLTQQSLDRKLLELQQLIESIYQSAAVRFGKSNVLATQFSTEVSEQFVHIKAKIREPLQPADVAEMKQLEQEIEHFGNEITLKVRQMGVKELADQYQFVYMIDPAPWLSPSVKFKPSLAFTELQVEEDKVVSGRPSQMNQGRGVKCEEILQATRRDGSTPDVIILTGEGGIGKTTLLKYLIEHWVCDPYAVPGLDQVDIMLYTQCRESGIRSLDQLLKQLLGKTLQAACVHVGFFRDIILRLKTIILVDGYDEANKDSEILVKDILQVAGNARVLVTSRPGSGDHLVRLIPSGKRCLDVLVKGIARELRSQYIDRMIDILVDQVDKRANIKESVNVKLEDLETTLRDHLHSPLTLTLVILLWVERPEKFNAFSTVTELYQEIRDLLTEKLLQRLTGKVNEAEDKCKQFLIVHDDIALQSLGKLEYDLSDDTVATLTEKCTSLGLPHVDVLSTYFSKKRSRRGLKLIWVWSYLHRGFQEHGAGLSIVKRLLAPGLEQGHASHQLAAPDNNPHTIEQILGGDPDGNISMYGEVMYRMTGALAGLSSDQHLVRYIPEIIQQMPLVISYNGSALIERHMLLVLESKNHQAAIQEVARKLSESRIWSSTGYYLRALPPVLSLTQPSELRMEILLDPELYPDLRETLVAIAKTTVNVTLQFVQHYLKSKDVSDTFLKAISSDSCTLTEFTGRVSSGSILPTTLQWLWLRCSGHDLHTLAPTLPHLQLKHLELHVEVSGRPSPGSFPVLPYTGDRLLVILEAGMTEAQAEVDWCCDVLRQLCPRHRQQGYDTLQLYQTQLTSVGVERLVRGLLQRGLLRRVGLYVRTSNQLTQEERQALQTLHQGLGGSWLTVE